MPARTFPKPIEATLENTYATSSSNGVAMAYSKTGGVVTFGFLSGKLTNAISADETVYTLPVGMRPHFQTHFVIQGSKNFYVSTDGGVKSTDALAANTYLKGSVTFAV